MLREVVDGNCVGGCCCAYRSRYVPQPPSRTSPAGESTAKSCSLEWRQVDFNAREVTLDPGKTKNGEGRTFPMTCELREVLEQQRAITENLQRQLKVVCPRVFHRSGRPIKSFRVHSERPCRRWMSGSCAARLPANRSPQSRARGRPGARGNADDGAQDPERVRAIQYRERWRPPRGRQASRYRDRDNFRDNREKSAIGLESLKFANPCATIVSSVR